MADPARRATHRPPPSPAASYRQYAGGAIAVALAAALLVYEFRGESAPAALGQGLIAAIALIAADRDTRRATGGDQ